MPDSTPIYGFTFPCPGETVSAAAFATLANQIDAKLLEVNADLTLALNRPNSDQNSAATVQTIPANVDTTLTLVGSTYTVPAAGVWVFHVTVTAATFPTVNMMRGTVSLNAVPRYRFMLNTEGNNVGPVQPVGAVVAAVGDVFTTQFLYNGAGTMDVRAEYTAKMIVRIP